MEARPLLSVIIPAYNAEIYIEECLNSVMQQKNASFEVVLVNDGSKDRTAEVCKKWAELCENIVYIEQKNQGQGTARNTAIAQACGQWLVFLDVDDTLLPGALEYLEASISDEYDMVCYGSVYISKNQEESHVHFPPDTEEKQTLMEEALSVLWDKMIRRELWERERIELSNAYGEDICPVYRMLAKARRIRTLQQPLICHFDREDNLSSHPKRILQIVGSVADTLETFEHEDLFETYQIPLFFMLEKQHRHYKNLWKMNGQKEELEIVKELEELALKYFPEEYQKALHIEEEALVIIGNISRPFPGVFENWRLYYYDCLELYLVDEKRPVDKVCHFIINAENEVKSVNRQIRTEEWSLAYWRMLCLELLETKKRYNLEGKIMLYSCKDQDERIERFEEAAQALWNCKRLGHLANFFRMTEEPDREDETERVHWHKMHLKAQDIQKLNYRWEYMRLENHVNVLCPWLRLKQQGRSLERYFLERGYQRIAVYGMGYLGKLLLEELRDSKIRIAFVMDCNKEQKTEYPLYSMEDVLPKADVIVVSVVHIYELLRSQLECKDIGPIISLQDVVDWC